MHFSQIMRSQYMSYSNLFTIIVKLHVFCEIISKKYLHFALKYIT